MAVLIGAVALFAGLNVQADFKFGELEVNSGKRLDVSIPVPAGKDDPATFIPLTVLAGASDGPTVLMVSGVHGFEFTPILAAEQLAAEIDPAALSGNLIIVRVAHVSAFEERSPYVNPYDRKNLNRSFPGSATGTQTERIAHALSTKLIPYADFVFDVHCGDGAEWLESFAGIYGGPLASRYDTALGVAKSLGLPNIVRYTMNTQAQIDTRRSLNRQAVAQGLPTALIEVGENGRRDPEFVATIVNGVRASLVYLKMLPGERPVASTSSRFFDGTQSVAANHSGLWHPTHRAGRYVEKGTLLGVIKGYDGKVLETVTSPVAGFTMYGLAGPPVRRGDSLLVIAQPVASLDE
jgi:predicted deacylase